MAALFVKPPPDLPPPYKGEGRINIESPLLGAMWVRNSMVIVWLLYGADKELLGKQTIT